MPLLSLSPLNVLTRENAILYQETSSEVVFFILFIYSRAFNNNVISNGKSYYCNDTFTDIAASKEYVRRIRIIFSCYNQHFISYFV